MNRQYPLLQKKLEEIESMMLETTEMADASDSDEVEWKIGFLNNLLERERISNPGGTPDHLSRIAGRLSEIERSFRMSIGNAASDKEIACQEEIVSMEDDLDDAESSCSCTHSCLNETDETPDEETESNSVPDTNYIIPSASKNMEAVQFNREERAQKERPASRGRCSIMVTLMVVVAAMIIVVTNFCTEEEHDYLVPT